MSTSAKHQLDLPGANTPQPAKCAHKRRGRFVTIAFLGLAWLFWSHHAKKIDIKADVFRQSAVGDDFDWDILPSEKLYWVDCYGRFQCARLEVPLDYSEPHGRKAAIALAKYPSKYPPHHPNWRGPILYNPGGPGGSGISTIIGMGANLSKLIGDEYDHIGFDPRGVGRTTPAFNLFPSQAERRDWDSRTPGAINSTADTLARHYGQAQIVGQLAKERGRNAAAYMTTAIVSRDMLSITRAHGREKLQYWGFRYGTVLGITFASMFPNNVERIIVDGVVDTYNYYEARWNNNLIDTDKGFDMAAESCAASSSCPLHEKTGKEVRKRIERILDSVKEQPVPVINGSSYGLADYTLARRFLFQSLYSPLKLFPLVASAFADLEKGDGRTLFRVANIDYSLWRCSCARGGQFPPDRLLVTGGWETTTAVACSDGDPYEGGLERLEKDYRKIAEYSSFADVWPIRAFCSGWKTRPVERYSGPFGGNTSFPILLIGNIADPVTPLWAAKKMAKGFNNSAILTQNSGGHCSVARSSLCTAKYIRAYFRNGTLPKEGTTCDVEGEIFPADNGPTDRNLINPAILSAEDAATLDAVRAISDRFVPPMLGLGMPQ